MGPSKNAAKESPKTGKVSSPGSPSKFTPNVNKDRFSRGIVPAGGYQNNIMATRIFLESVISEVPQGRIA